MRSAWPPSPRLRRASCCAAAQPFARIARRRSWWSQTGSNRRPHACKARALPTELWPECSKSPLSWRKPKAWLAEPGSRRLAAFALAAPARQPPLAPRAKLVGPGRLELPTSRLSGVRSNQLSYGPSAAPKRTENRRPLGSRSRQQALVAGQRRSKERETKTAATCTCLVCSMTTK